MAQQTVLEWLANKLYEFNGHDNPWFDIPLHLLEQAKQMEKEQMKKMYNHAMLSLLDTGHGETFDEYYIRIYGE